MKRLLVCLTILLAALPFSGYAASIEVLGKHNRADGSVYDFKILDGDALSPGDRFQIVVKAVKRTYYAVIYFSRDGKAVKLFPLQNSRGDIKAGTELFLPSRDNFFTLDTNGGRELMFVVTSPNALKNLRSALRGAEQVGGSSEGIYEYLKNRFSAVKKLEITNTGGKISGMADQVSSRLVHDISKTYKANPWPESFSEATDSRKRTRRASDSSIPAAVRRRAKEVRALLSQAPKSTSLRTVAAEKKVGKVRRDTAMLAKASEEKKAAEAKVAESRRLEAERIAEAKATEVKAAEPIKRLEQQQLAAREEAEEKRLQEELAEIARLKEEEKRLEEEKRIAAEAEEKARRFEAHRIEAERAAAEAQQLEEKRLELAKAEEAARRQEEERIAAEKAAAEVLRLEEEQRIAKQAAEAKRLEQEQTEAARVAEENQRLQEEKAIAVAAAAESKRLAEENRRLEEERAVAEAKRLEEERAAASLAATEVEKPAEEKAKPFGGLFSFLNNNNEVAEAEPDTFVKDSEIVSPETAVEVTVGEPVAVEIDQSSRVVDTTEQQPLEAVVVLKAPVRPAPPKLNAPAPVRPKAKPAKALDAESLRQLYADIASAVVSIEVDGETDSGFILDSLGHILSSWHLVNGKKEVDVRFIGVSGESPSFKAKVIKHNKFRDLALLKLVNPPEGIQPITLASGQLPDAGSKVRVFGHKDGQVWATDDAVITRIAQNFTWFSKGGVIHRGEILQVDLPAGGKGIGALVTSLDYKLLGIKSFSGKETGRTYAVSVHNILDFLQPGK